jgi:hypothetical protein
MARSEDWRSHWWFFPAFLSVALAPTGFVILFDDSESRFVRALTATVLVAVLVFWSVYIFRRLRRNRRNRLHKHVIQH